MQLHGGEPCWGRNDGGRSYFENVLMGTSCDNNWYEGFMGWQEWNGDAPAVLGFDSSIDGYCRGLQGRRRRLARGNATTGNAADGDDATTMSNRRRRLNAAWLCHEVNRNILVSRRLSPVAVVGNLNSKIWPLSTLKRLATGDPATFTPSYLPRTPSADVVRNQCARHLGALLRGGTGGGGA